MDEQRVKILEKKAFFNPEKIRETIEKLSVRIIHRDDDDFPPLLRNIPDCPTILYVRGTLPTTDACISVVGSRKHSQYAEASLEKIIPDLVAHKYSIISGGAYGIDTVAHETAVKSGGHTVVVFGAGIDVLYPPRNANSFEEVIQK